MIKCESIGGGDLVKLKDADYKRRKAEAYSAGSTNHPYKFEFLFEREYWLKGLADNERIHSEIERGER